MNRREFLKKGAIGLTGVLTSACGINKPFQEQLKNIPYEENKKYLCNYTELNPNIVSKKAYSDYDKNGCMYGVFNGIISQLEEKLGELYTSFPPRNDAIWLKRNKQLGFYMRDINPM